jgi:hypothetical protein
MLNAVQCTTTESEIVIRVHRSNLDSPTFEQIGSYFLSLVGQHPSSDEQSQFQPSRLKAEELRRLPKEQRNAIIRAQVALVQDYEIMDDDQDVVENYHETI